MLAPLDNLDRYLSNKIHNLHLPQPFDALITLIGYMFNRPHCFIFIGYFIVVFVPSYEVSTKSMWFYFTHYLQLMLTVLVLTLTLKKALKRPRPVCPNLVSRKFNLRGLENNNAMPSGDTAQASMFVFYLLSISNIATLFQQYVLLLIPLVALGRIYHHCHWIGDTIGGALLGYLVFRYSPHVAHTYLQLV